VVWGGGILKPQQSLLLLLDTSCGKWYEQKKRKQRIDYPNIPSAIRPVPHGEDLPVPEPPKEYN